MQRTFFKAAIVGPAFAAILGTAVMITGQPALKLSQQPAPPVLAGVPDDWSHHHLVFSNPGTYEEAVKTTASYVKWLTIQEDPRFILQQMKRHAAATGGLSGEMSTGGAKATSPPGVVEPEDGANGTFRQGQEGEFSKAKPKPEPKPKALKKDWNEVLSTGTVQPNTFPAKWGPSLTSASCADDYVVYPTGAAGSSVQASIVAYANLYSGTCSGTVPSVYWAYNTGGTVSTSPTISWDGTQVAFIQVASSVASLVVLKWAVDSSLVTLTSNASYPSCPAPCMIALTLSGSPNDTFSAPFYDSSHDAFYVGDDKGNLHMFTGVFGGTPTEVTAPSPWAVSVGGKNITSPVYDPVTGNVFVGDMGGYLYAVGTGNMGTTAGSVTASANFGDAVIDAPLVDSSAERVYAFVTTSPSGFNAVCQFSTSFANGSTCTNGTNGQRVGTGGSGYYLYAGDFDNVYYQSTDPPSGNLYVLGNTASAAALYRIPITSNVMGTPVSISGANTPPWPSPAVEFCNNGASACGVTTGGTCGAGVTCTSSGTDYLFFSIYYGTGCGASSTQGCIYAYNISNQSSLTLSSYMRMNDVSSPGCWATGGIVIDNSDPSAGASQVYFIGLNGNSAGGAGGATSGKCKAGSGNNLLGYQAAQAGLD